MASNGFGSVKRAWKMAQEPTLSSSFSSTDSYVLLGLEYQQAFPLPRGLAALVKGTPASQSHQLPHLF